MSRLSSNETRTIELLRRRLLTITVLITVSFTPWFSVDSFNPVKFSILTVGCFYLILNFRELMYAFLCLKNRIFTLFLVSSIYLSVILASNFSSISEKLFGAQGRLLGFITFIAFSIYAILSTIAFYRSDNPIKLLGLILKSIQTASIIVFSIATLQKANIAFQNFDTDFASLPSTLGNPNFMSAFMAIAAFSWLPSLNQKRTKSSKFLANRLYSLMGVVGCLYGVYLADSFQGYVILIAGVMGLIFFFLYTRKRKKTLTFLCGLSTLLAIPVLAGLANKGPLASLIYQETIAFRFYYWKVAIRAVINSPLFGYGFDTYEYVFRLFRSREEYLRLPGVVSDSSHNIFLDLAIFGGVPLSLLWLTLSLIALKNICNLLRKFGNNTNGDNFIIVSGVMTFFGLQLQSLINPFQFGISIWLLLITIFFCVQSLGPELKDSKHRRKNSEILINGIKGKKRVFVSSFMVVLTIVINPLFCALPLVTDIRFRNAVQSSSPNRLLAVALSWPIVPSRTQSIADGLVNSTLNNGGFAPGTIDGSILRLQKQLGIDLGEKLTLLSPNSFVAWEFVYKNEENVFKKKAALIQLRRLDPSNTEWEKDN